MAASGTCARGEKQLTSWAKYLESQRISATQRLFASNGAIECPWKGSSAYARPEASRADGGGTARPQLRGKQLGRPQTSLARHIGTSTLQRVLMLMACQISLERIKKDQMASLHWEPEGDAEVLRRGTFLRLVA